MVQRRVGKIKNIQYNSETDELDVTFSIEDSSLKKSLLRKFYLKKNLKIEGDYLVLNEDNTTDNCEG
jgi:hypothetical protein